jgi:outer membrane protein TolC
LQLGSAAPTVRAVSLESPNATPEQALLADVTPGQRNAVRRAIEETRQREQLLSATRAARWPELAVTSSYERVGYSRQGLPEHRDFRTNWTVGARVDFPLFTAGDRSAREAEARAELTSARAELRRTEQLARLDIASASSRLSAATAAWAASEGSVREATHAYEIAALRHKEGLAIQLELFDARLALEESKAERARAARDLLVERLRAALLPDLPLSVSASR